MGAGGWLVCPFEALDSFMKRGCEKFCLSLFEADFVAPVRPATRTVYQPVDHPTHGARSKAQLLTGFDEGLPIQSVRATIQVQCHGISPAGVGLCAQQV